MYVDVDADFQPTQIHRETWKHNQHADESVSDDPEQHGEDVPMYHTITLQTHTANSAGSNVLFFLPCCAEATENAKFFAWHSATFCVSAKLDIREVQNPVIFIPSTDSAVPFPSQQTKRAPNALRSVINLEQLLRTCENGRSRVQQLRKIPIGIWMEKHLLVTCSTRSTNGAVSSVAFISSLCTTFSPFTNP